MKKMENKLSFVEVKDLKSFLEKYQDKRSMFVFNFLNSNDIYYFSKEPKFKKTFSRDSINFIDGFVISFFLSLKKFRHIKRLSGPDFTRKFFEIGKMSENKKQLFIGLENSDLKDILIRYPYLKEKDLFCYNPPFIKGIEFSDKEVNKISKLINSKKIDYVWIGLGCPKQNILTYELFKNTGAIFFFNVGAALDFLLEKKKRAPKIFRQLGIEWLYRLITDFKHSKKKVMRSFKAIFCLRCIR